MPFHLNQLNKLRKDDFKTLTQLTVVEMKPPIFLLAHPLPLREILLLPPRWTYGMVVAH